eukprot:g1849.t1
MKLFALCILLPSAAKACTVFAAGRKATADGSVIVTHSDDGEGTSDARVAYIAAANHSAGARRPIWPDLEDYPRFVGDNPARGADGVFAPKPGQELTAPIGYIPQVRHTYAYLDSNFAMQNEKQVSIGETTCSAIFGSVAIGKPNGTALMSVNELSRIALERAATAREAIETMGDLASKHGFYGPGTFEGTGETLAVADPTEAFIMHFLPDDTGYSALWVAQRVPDENVTVVANMFTVREVDCDDKHNFFCSPNLHSVALKHKLWDGSGLLDFTGTYSDGEYAHKYYSGRRMWGALRTWVPKMRLNPEYNNLKNSTNPSGRAVKGWTSHFPWSVKPETPVTAQTLMDLHRDHYEGTEFDTTKGIAAGPWGTPDRYATLGTDVDRATGSKGAWERTIGLYRTTFSWVIQARSWLPDAVGGTTWFGTADADKTVFLPLYVAAGGVPQSLMVGHQTELDRSALYWAHRYVQNLVQMRYAPMMKDVRKLQSALENDGKALQYELDTQFGKATNEQLRGELAAQLQTAVREREFAHTSRVLRAWWQLADMLMVKHADGYMTTDDNIGQPQGYPAWFLNITGFHNGPQRIDNDHP